MLFIVRHDESVFESNPHLSLMSAFKGITDEQFKYVAFYADWKSPLRNLPDTQRKDAAMLDSGIDSTDGLEKYVEAYYEMQGITNERESVGALDAALVEIRNRLRNPKDLLPDDFKKLSSALVDLTKQRKMITDLINDRLNVEDVVIGEDDGLSTADRYGG
jgi:hypothetical protein